MKGKVKPYLKWMFTRWYFYLLFLFGLSLNQGDFYRIESILGMLLGNIIAPFIIISIFVLLKKGFKKLRKK